MSKAYICDHCGTVITDPHGVKFREYSTGYHLEGGRITRKLLENEHHIDLCSGCYSKLIDPLKQEESDDE